MKPLLLAAIVAMAASGPAWAQSSTATGAGRHFQIHNDVAGDLGAGRHGDDHQQQHRAGRSDGQERTERFRTRLGRGRARNVPRVGFRRRRVCRDRTQLRHHDP